MIYSYNNNSKQLANLLTNTFIVNITPYTYIISDQTESLIMLMKTPSQTDISIGL